ncbi:MAG TPA: phosphotransferase family protein, partial [Baekduia sp.]
MDDPGPPPALRAWIEETVGGPSRGWRRLVSGNSRTTWAADVDHDGADVLALAVRVDEGDGPFSGTPLTLAREAGVYAALQGRPVAIPRRYGYDAGLRALALERVGGAPAWDEDVLAGVLREAARLHALDAGTVDLPGAGRRASADLDLWAAIADARLPARSPLVDFAVDLLRETFPGEPERLVVVHGDLGIGNVLWDGTRVTALLDWELTHYGDPHDDLAFLTVRSALHGLPLPGFGDAAREHYAAPAGLALDPARLRYWQAVGVLRNLVTCLASIANPVRGRDRLVHHLLVPSLDRLLLGRLAGLVDVALPAPAPLEAAAALPGGDVFAEIARELGDLVPAIPDADRRQRARRMRHLLAQLAETW